MIELGKQTEYWDKVADKKVFSHPIQFNKLKEYLSKESKILDFGCGYGRVCNQFLEYGYSNIMGVDISKKMIERGLSINPSMNLIHSKEDKLPFENNIFDACSLMAVLTCVTPDLAQQNILDEIYRVLKPGGLLYVSDMYLQKDKRNIDRYNQYQNEFNNYGVFKLPDNGVVRHHPKEWIKELCSKFKIENESLIETVTMNGNKTEIFQMILIK